MPSFLKNTAKAIADSLGLEVTRRPRKAPIERVRFASYQEASLRCETASGYQHPPLLDVIYAKTVSYRETLERQISLSESDAYLVSVLLFLAQGRAKLKVVDFGGACGVHYFLARKVLQGQTGLKWKVVETPAMTKRARDLASDELEFYSVLADADPGSADLAFIAGSLQFTDDPRAHLRSLLSFKARHLLVLRGNFTTETSDSIMVQRTRLSENGIGQIPEGFTDGDVYYPNSAMPGVEFDRMVFEAGYVPLLSFQDRSGLHGQSRTDCSGLYVLSSASQSTTKSSAN